MVETIQVDVGEELTGQVADGQPSPPLIRTEQVVPSKVEVHRLLRVGAVDDAVRQCQSTRTGNATTQITLQDFMVDSGEVAVDVATQHGSEPVTKRLVTGDGAMRSLADAVGGKCRG